MAPRLVHAAFHRDGWVYEEKVDGWRMLAYKDGQRVRLVSRNGRDHTLGVHNDARPNAVHAEIRRSTPYQAPEKSFPRASCGESSADGTTNGQCTASSIDA